MLSRGFDTWRDVFCEVRSRERSASRTILSCIRRLEMLDLSAGMNKWKEVVVNLRLESERNAKRSVHVVSKVMRCMLNNKLHSALNRWVEVVRTMSDRRGAVRTVTMALKRLQKQKLSRAFRKWHQVCNLQARTTRFVQRYVSRWIKSHLSRSFRTWIEFTRAQEERDYVARRAILGWIRRHLRAAFLKWHEFLEKQKYNRNLLLKVIQRLRMRRVCAAWNVWIELCQSSHKTLLRTVLRCRVSYLYRRCALQRAVIQLLRDANSNIRNSKSTTSSKELRDLIRANIVKQLIVHLRHSHRYTLKEAFHRLHVHWHSCVLKSTEAVKMKRLEALKRFQRKHHISLSPGRGSGSTSSRGRRSISSSPTRRRRSLLHDD